MYLFVLYVYWIGLHCNQLKMELDAANKRNRLLFDNFTLYCLDRRVMV